MGRKKAPSIFFQKTHNPRLNTMKTEKPTLRDTLQIPVTKLLTKLSRSQETKEDCRPAQTRGHLGAMVTRWQCGVLDRILTQKKVVHRKTGEIQMKPRT